MLPNGANFAPNAVFGENKELHAAQKCFLPSQGCRGNMIVAHRADASHPKGLGE
jgi:hypothetical protein